MIKQAQADYVNNGWLREGSRLLKATKWFGVLAVLLVVTLWLVYPQPLERDAPRDLPWQLPDYRLANTHWEVGPQGKIHTSVEHFFLEDITPDMVAWFYQQLPISTIAYKGVTYPLYHIFHPTEHGTLRVVAPAFDGTPGMATGALIARDEWFGSYDSRGTARIIELSPSGMLAIPQFFGLEIGEVRHSFKGLNGGTSYRVDTIIGSNLPVIGRLLNFYIRTWVFHPQMLEQWQRHQVEEVASLQFFLAQIYRQRGGGQHFTLD